MTLEQGGQAFRVDVVVAGGGGAAAKMVVGDRIIAINGIAVAALGADGAMDKILGAKGTTVSFTLQRNGQPVTLLVERTHPPQGAKKKLSLDFTDMSEVLERKISP